MSGVSVCAQLLMITLEYLTFVFVLNVSVKNCLTLYLPLCVLPKILSWMKIKTINEFYNFKSKIKIVSNLEIQIMNVRQKRKTKMSLN